MRRSNRQRAEQAEAFLDDDADRKIRHQAGVRAARADNREFMRWTITGRLVPLPAFGALVAYGLAPAALMLFAFWNDRFILLGWLPGGGG